MSTSKTMWRNSVYTNDDSLYLTTVEFTVSTDSATDGYVEAPGNISVTNVSGTADGYFTVTLSDVFTSVRYAHATIITNAEDDSDTVRIRGIDATNGKIYLQAQSAPGTDANPANGTKIMLLVAGVKRGPTRA